MAKKVITTALQGLGLSKGGEQVYLNLLEKGPQQITDISRGVKQFRVDVYKHINELVQFGLVKLINYGKRKRYEASSPEFIFNILKEKEKGVSDYVTGLLKVFDRQQEGFSVETFAGKNGIETVYELLVKDAKRKSQLLRIESPISYHRNKKYYPKSYWQRAGFRSGGDLEKYVITNTLTNNSRRKNLNRSSKSIPEKYNPFSFDLTTIIVGEKVAYIDFELEKAFLIRNKRFADYMTAIFWMLYEKL